MGIQRHQKKETKDTVSNIHTVLYNHYYVYLLVLWQHKLLLKIVLAVLTILKTILKIVFDLNLI